MLEKWFKLSERGTTVKTEMIAGLTTFMTLAYILAVNPSILTAAGMDATAVLLATSLASCIASVVMGLMANLPFVLTAGMGLNAYFANTVVLGMGYPWQVALLAVFIEGLLFIVMSLTKVREAIFNAIPLSLKHAVSVGIGLFIAFLGFQNAGLAVINNGQIGLLDFTAHFQSTGISALLAFVGLLLTAILYVKHVKGHILFGILVTWLLGMLCQVTGLYVPDPSLGCYSLYPTFALTDFTKLGETVGQCLVVDFSTIRPMELVVVVFSFLFVDLFDTLGTIIGVSSKAGMLDEQGRLPQIRPALMADAIGTTVGALLGTSTVTTCVESSSGIGVGGRTGLTAIVSGFLFLLSTLFAPIFTAIPAFATAPALIMVGFLMFSSITNIRLADGKLTEIIPAFLTIIAMPFFNSISEGICIGIISHVILNLVTGKGKKVPVLLYILAVLFILKYIFI